MSNAEKLYEILKGVNYVGDDKKEKKLYTNYFDELLSKYEMLDLQIATLYFSKHIAGEIKKDAKNKFVLFKHAMRNKLKETR